MTFAVLVWRISSKNSRLKSSLFKFYFNLHSTSVVIFYSSSLSLSSVFRFYACFPLSFFQFLPSPVREIDNSDYMMTSSNMASWCTSIELHHVPISSPWCVSPIGLPFGSQFTCRRENRASQPCKQKWRRLKWDDAIESRSRKIAACLVRTRTYPLSRKCKFKVGDIFYH